MKLSTVKDLMEAVPHAEYSGASGTKRRNIQGFSTDTRSLKKGEAFIAIRGDNFDGHDFIGDAATAGASVAIVGLDWYRLNSYKKIGIPGLVVHDTLAAYGVIARIHRENFTIPIVAIAGSNGKTTTKDRAAAVLAKKYNVLKTSGNLNNLIGVPATLLNLTKQHEAAVIEIGTNSPGEIAKLCAILKPTHGLITNIGREHLELLDSLEGVAEEEGALFRYLAKNGGTAFVNLDDSYIKRLAKNLSVTFTYGNTKKADLQGKAGKLEKNGAPQVTLVNNKRSNTNPVKVQLRTTGKHTGYNALAAAAVGYALKVPAKKIKEALEEYQTEVSAHGYARMAVMNADDGTTIINDTYNANPDSVLTALDTLAAMKVGRKGKRIAVLADMKELGWRSEAEHQEIGKTIAGMKKIDVVMFFGREMRRAYEAIAQSDTPASVMSFYFRKKERLTKVLSEILTGKDAVLVKGSRGMKMEEVVMSMTSPKNNDQG